MLFTIFVHFFLCFGLSTTFETVSGHHFKVPSPSGNTGGTPMAWLRARLGWRHRSFPGCRTRGSSPQLSLLRRSCCQLPQLQLLLESPAELRDSFSRDPERDQDGHNLTSEKYLHCSRKIFAETFQPSSIPTKVLIKVPRHFNSVIPVETRG